MLMNNQAYADEEEDPGHHEVELIEEMGTMRAPDHCSTSTKELLITSKDDASLAYDKEEYQLEKNTCYNLTFKNLALIEHDFTIDEVEGENGIEPIVLHASDSTSGVSGGGAVSMNIMTPNADTEFYTRCTIPGHEAGGMFATLIVGEGNPENDTGFLPGLEIPILITSLLVISLFTRYKK